MTDSSDTLKSNTFKNENMKENTENLKIQGKCFFFIYLYDYAIIVI